MSTLSKIENLVGVITLSDKDVTLTAFEKYTERELAVMLCTLAVTHLDAVDAQAQAVK